MACKLSPELALVFSCTQWQTIAILLCFSLACPLACVGCGDSEGTSIKSLECAHGTKFAVPNAVGECNWLQQRKLHSPAIIMHPRPPGMHIAIDSKLIILSFELRVFVCRHVSIWGFQNRVCLSVPREKKSLCLRQYQSYINNWYINGKVFTITTVWKPKNLIFFFKVRNWISSTLINDTSTKTWKPKN